MAKEELTGKPLNDVHKVVFLANEYPKKTLQDLAKLFELPALDINNAIWRAQDMGFLVINGDSTFSVDRVPDSDMWQFGESVESLKAQLIYYFKHLARSESDIEETYLGNVTGGYPSHDVFVALKVLLADRVLATYQITDLLEIPASKKAKGKGKKPEVREDVYTFYTLWENSEQQWGKKQFKDTSKLK